MYCRLEFFILRKVGIIRFKDIWKKSIIKYGLFGWTHNITIGNYVYIWESVRMWWEWWLSIWDNTIIGPNVTMRTTNHDYKKWDFLPYWPWIEKREIKIGENCWIWEWVYINPWSQIGEWSIIWMWTVVSGKIPPLSIVVGASTRQIKKRDMMEYKKLKKERAFYLEHKLEWKI